MAQIFSSNQVSQVLVAGSCASVSSASAVGTTYAGKTADGKYLYFTQMGKGGIVRSDLIEVDSVMSAKAVIASTMFRNLKYSLIKLNPDCHTTTTLGGSYVLNLEFMNPVGISPDNKYCKFAAVNTTSTMTASDFYGKLAKSVAQNMARENVQLITPTVMYAADYVAASGATAGDVVYVNGKIYICKSNVSGGTAFDPTASTYWAEADLTKTSNFSTSVAYSAGDVVVYSGAGYVTKSAGHSAGAWNSSHFAKVYDIVNANTNVASLSSITGVILMEAAQKDWRLGHIQDKALVWNTSFSPVIANNDEYPWGVETLMKGTALNNSKKAAELEYFCMGERADVYRGAGYPNNIDTEYMVDSTAANGYDMICIHYAYTGSNHAVQKSEKDLFIIAPGNSTVGTIGSVASSLKTLVNSTLGFTNLIA